MTAVEWLMKELSYDNGFGVRYPSHNEMAELNEYFEQAKEMEKQQIIAAQSYAISKADMTNNRGFFDCEQYYNETFNISPQDKP